MKYRIVRVEDTDEMHEIHKMAFGGDPWPGDDHEFWVAYDSHGAVAGFASAILLDTRTVFLSRAAVTIDHQGRGLHQKLIAARLRWAKFEGADFIVTHVEQYNYASLVSLLKAKFRLVERAYCPRGYGNFHFLQRGDYHHGVRVQAALLATVTE